jgi:hypothetical protein
MRELIVTQNITLDGVIDAAEGWFDASGEEGSTSRTSSRRFAKRSRPPTRCSSGG